MQNESLHYVQVYTVKDRVDFSSFTNCPPSSAKYLYSILPTSDDYQKLKENMAQDLVLGGNRIAGRKKHADMQGCARHNI